MAPIALAARCRPAISHHLIATGQQDILLDQAIDQFNVKVDSHLGLSHGIRDVALQVDAMRDALATRFTAHRPDLVLVQGDTNSAYAAALAANDKGIAVGHVEAGLRTHIPGRPWPEERNRCAIGAIATYHFAPSVQAMHNLCAEHVPGTAFLTGNPGIDALLMSTRPVPRSHEPIHRIIVTCHRRENFGAPLLDICLALRTIAQRHDVQLTLPLHTNSQVRDIITSVLTNVERIQLVEPLDYPDMIAAIRSARMVISDSGGLQEECAALGVPLILMREETERPEVVRSGNCVLTGASTGRIIAEAHRLLDDEPHHALMSFPSFHYGDGSAAKRILDIIEHII